MKSIRAFSLAGLFCLAVFGIGATVSAQSDKTGKPENLTLPTNQPKTADKKNIDKPVRTD